MRTRFGYALSVMGIALLCIGTAHAGQPPETKCEAGKNQESGKYAYCLAKADAKLLKTKGLCSIAATVCYRDEECPGVETCDKDTTKYGLAVTKCEDKYEAKWDKLTQKAVDAGSSCPDGLLREDVKEVIDECVSNVASGLAGEGLSDCPGDLTTCGGDLTTCNGSLGTCNTSLGTCNTDLTTAQNDLSTCTGSLGTCTTDLGTCNGNYATCSGDLTTCQGDLNDCQNPTCGDNQADLGEQCDGSDLNGATCSSLGFAGGSLGCSSCTYNTSGCTLTDPSAKLIFVTAAVYTPGVDFTGLSGADALCQSLAEAAGHGGAGIPSFKAWMSDSTANAATRISGVTTGTFVNTKGEVVKTGGLTNGQPLAAPVHYTQTGAEASGAMAVTATTAFGAVTSGTHCTDWTIATGSVRGGQSLSAHSTAWTQGSSSSCGGWAMYCVEED